MNPSLWLLVALTTWWSVSTVNCGGRECFPYVIFFYSAFWLPVVAYLAGAEALADALSVRWRALTHLRAPIYTLFASAGFWGLVALLHTSRLAPTIQSGMILFPSAAVAALYLIRSLNLIGIFGACWFGDLPWPKN
jgi:hypothetical protein